MSKKILAFCALLAFILGFLFSCKSVENIESISSTVANREEIVIGSANEGGYPNYDSSVDFSDVSADLTSDSPLSSNASKNDSSSQNPNKNSSKNTTT